MPQILNYPKYFDVTDLVISSYIFDTFDHLAFSDDEERSYSFLKKVAEQESIFVKFIHKDILEEED